MQKAGAWYSYGDDRIGQGKDNAREYLKEHPEAAAELEAKIRQVKGVAQVTKDAQAVEAEEKTVEV